MQADLRRGVPATAPAWARLGTLGLSLAGLAVSVYLTVEHYTASTTLACPESATVNCQKVTTSPQSIIAGVPVAVLGLVFFVAMVGLTLPVVWASDRRGVRLARLGAAVVGVLMVFYLLYAELFKVDAICLWCTVVHVITVALFAVLVLDLTRDR
jgi:uncharacterized membrane protein